MLQKYNFYDGLEQKIDINRLIDFDNRQSERYFTDVSIEVSKLFEDLGPYILDYTNLQPWTEENPDISEKSTRVFTLWAEEIDTKKICLILRGFFALSPFSLGASTYYNISEKNTSFYPLAILSNFRTNYTDSAKIDSLIDQAMKEINTHWKKLRMKTIERLTTGSDLWHRYNYTIDKIIHFTIQCPSMDRELTESLRRKGYRTTGVMQLLSSPVEEYSKASLDEHIRKAQEYIKSTHEVED